MSYINTINQRDFNQKDNVCACCFEETSEVSHMLGIHLCHKCIDKTSNIYTNENSDVNSLQIDCEDNQSAKADADKPILSLVPKQIIYEIEKVRAFGSKKYKDHDNWKKVELERYHQALLRHTLAVWDDINAKDKESGLLHLSHMATNIAFILELMNSEE